MKVKLLREVAKDILENKDKFDMAKWCGTAGCIAGFAAARATGESIEALQAVILRDASTPAIGDTVHKIATTALELTSAQAHRLFYTLEWPSRFRVAYNFSTPPDRARVTFDRIEAFIRSNGLR